MGIITVITILGMVLLVLASVCLPADVQIVDCFNQDVINFARNMAPVCIVPLVRLSLINLLVNVCLLPKHEVYLVHW